MCFADCLITTISTQTFRKAWTASQLCGDKECPFSCLTNSGTVWRNVAESDARSVTLSAQLSRHITRVKHRGFGFEKKKRRRAYVFSIISMCRVSSVRNSQDNSAMLNHPKASPFSIILALVKLEKKKKKKKEKKEKRKGGGGGGGGGEKKSFCHCQWKQNKNRVRSEATPHWQKWSRRYYYSKMQAPYTRQSLVAAWALLSVISACPSL